jgi:hypothetical protein
MMQLTRVMMQCALTGGSVMASRRQGTVSELAGALGRAPGKAIGGGACFRLRHSSAARELW